LFGRSVNTITIVGKHGVDPVSWSLDQGVEETLAGAASDVDYRPLIFGATHGVTFVKRSS
jgi:hypothetical protein